MMHIVMVITQCHYTYIYFFVFSLFFMTLLDFFFGGVLKSMLTLNEAIIDVKEG